MYTSNLFKKYKYLHNKHLNVLNHEFTKSAKAIAYQTSQTNMQASQQRY